MFALVSQLKAFADPEVLKLDGAHYATVKAYFESHDKKSLGNRDYFTCCYAANVGIKKDKPTVVDDAFLASRIKAKAGTESSEAPADGSKTAEQLKAESDQKAAAAKSALTASIKAAKTAGGLNAIQTMAIDAVCQAFGITL